MEALSRLRNQKEYTEDQFCQLIEEMGYARPDLSSGARPDTEVADEMRANAKMPFLEADMVDLEKMTPEQRERYEAEGVFYGDPAKKHQAPHGRRVRRRCCHGLKRLARGVRNAQ